MKKANKILIILIIICNGCSSSKITSYWKDTTVVSKEYKKIMVLGLIRESDRSLQQNMENHLVDDLQIIGYNAISALQYYGPKSFEKMEEQAAIEKIKNTGVDAVITIVLLDKKKERKYIPGNIYYSPYSYFYNHFWGYRSTLYNRIHEPGYYVTDTKYFWESNLYDMETQKLIYSVQTQSFEPSSSEIMGHEYGQMIVKNMINNTILNNNKR
jgi:hypothetical protein